MRYFDLHCDTLVTCLETGKSLMKNDLHVSVEKGDRYAPYIQCAAIWLPDKIRGEAAEKWFNDHADLFDREAAAGGFTVIRTGADIEAIENKQGTGMMLTVEGSAVLAGKFENIRHLRDRGVRMMTLTWNYPNELGFPNLNGYEGKRIRQEHDPVRRAAMIDYYLDMPDEDNGLTRKGLEFISKMEELGMIIDISHLSDAGFYDVLEYTKKPFVASHSNARKVCSCVRNMTNEMIRGLAERGGVMGLNFCSDFLTRLPAGTPNPGTIAAIVEHAKHIVKVGGIEVLGLGSDFDGIDTHAELPHAGKMHLLFDALKKGGFTESQIDKILFGNVLRVYQEVLK